MVTYSLCHPRAYPGNRGGGGFFFRGMVSRGRLKAPSGSRAMLWWGVQPTEAPKFVNCCCRSLTVAFEGSILQILWSIVIFFYLYFTKSFSSKSSHSQSTLKIFASISVLTDQTFNSIWTILKLHHIDLLYISYSLNDVGIIWWHTSDPYMQDIYVNMQHMIVFTCDFFNVNMQDNSDHIHVQHNSSRMLTWLCRMLT